MLIQGIDRERHGGICGRRQTVCLAANLNDIRSVAASGALNVVCVNRASLECANRVLHKPRFVDRVCVDRDLHVEFFRNAKRTIDGRWRRAPVFMKLQANRPRLDLLAQRFRKRRIAFAQKS